MKLFWIYKVNGCFCSFKKVSQTLQATLRSLVFQIVERFHLSSLYLRMFGKGLQLKTTTPLVFFLWLVFEKLVNIRIVDHLDNCDLFSGFQYGFRSSESTANHLAVVSHGIARLFNRSWATQAVAPRLLTGFGMLVFFTKLSLMEF